MRNDFFTITFFLLSVTTYNCFASGNIKIYVDENFQARDVRGETGHDGRIGKNCDNGENGKDGFSGENTTIFYESVDDLKNLTLDQRGGQGGLGGRRGHSLNCGNRYPRDGRDGYVGLYGHSYLVAGNKKIPTDKLITEKILLKKLDGKSIVFVRNEWKKKTGLEKLLATKSQVKSNYSLFLETSFLDLNVKVDSNIEQSNVKVTLELRGDKIRFNVYKNNRYEGNTLVDYEVDFKKSILLIKNLYLKKDLVQTKVISTKNTGKKTKLVFVDETFHNQDIETHVSITLYKYKTFIDHYSLVGSSSLVLNEYTSFGETRNYIVNENSKLNDILNGGGKFKISIHFKKSLRSNSIYYKKEAFFKVD